MSPKTEEPAEPVSASPVDDDTRKKVLEAMARKQGKKPDGTAGHAQGGSAKPPVNAKARRRFGGDCGVRQGFRDD